MTVTSAQAKITHTGNGSTREFSFNFKTLSSLELSVTITSTSGAVTEQSPDTNYTVSGVGVDTGGSITFNIAPGSGEIVSISRNMAFTQETNYTASDKFPAESHETALDRLCMQSQQVKDLAERGIKLPVSESSAGVLPLSSARAGKVLSFKDNGDPETNSNNLLSASDIRNLISTTSSGSSASVSSLVTHIASSTNAVSTNVQEVLRRSVNLKDFGAIGDSIQDDSLALVNAMNYLRDSGGGTLYVPDGEYRLSANVSRHRITGTSPVNISVIGSSKENCILFYDRQFLPDVGFKIEYVDAAACGKIEIRNISVVTNGYQTTSLQDNGNDITNDGIYIKYPDDISVDAIESTYDQHAVKRSDARNEVIIDNVLVGRKGETGLLRGNWWYCIKLINCVSPKITNSRLIGAVDATDTLTHLPWVDGTTQRFEFDEYSYEDRVSLSYVYPTSCGIKLETCVGDVLVNDTLIRGAVTAIDARGCKRKLTLSNVEIDFCEHGLRYDSSDLAFVTESGINNSLTICPPSIHVMNSLIATEKTGIDIQKAGADSAEDPQGNMILATKFFAIDSFGHRNPSAYSFPDYTGINVASSASFNHTVIGACHFSGSQLRASNSPSDSIRTAISLDDCKVVNITANIITGRYGHSAFHTRGIKAQINAEGVVVDNLNVIEVTDTATTLVNPASYRQSFTQGGTVNNVPSGNVATWVAFPNWFSTSVDSVIATARVADNGPTPAVVVTDGALSSLRGIYLRHNHSSPISIDWVAVGV